MATNPKQSQYNEEQQESRDLLFDVVEDIEDVRHVVRQRRGEETNAHRGPMVENDDLFSSWAWPRLRKVQADLASIYFWFREEPRVVVALPKPVEFDEDTDIEDVTNLLLSYCHQLDDVIRRAELPIPSALAMEIARVIHRHPGITAGEIVDELYKGKSIGSASLISRAFNHSLKPYGFTNISGRGYLPPDHDGYKDIGG